LTVRIVLLLGLAVTASASARGQEAAEGPDPDRDDRLGLADLAGYRAALAGKATADDARPTDPPARVGFRDVWKRPETYRGRRVIVEGRLERTFRQGAVGTFPPLVEAWIFSPSGDPLCLVYPQAGAGIGPAGVSAPGTASDARHDGRAATPAVPEPGRAVRFTGTFLKMVRYAAGDGERLAPLIVGDRPPEPPPPAGSGESAAIPPGAGEVLRAIGGGGRDDGPVANRTAWMSSSWTMGLVLAAVAAVVIAGQHLRGARLRDHVAERARLRDRTAPDPPLHFVDPPEDVSR
jgi:hypothetical protein